MCVSTGPSEMSKTIVYAAEVRGRDGGREHVLGYQNTARSDRPNGMLIALPSAGPLTRANAIDMTACPNLLRDLRELTTPRSRGGGLLGLASRGAEVFDVGSYTVISSDSPLAFGELLASVPEAKRPEPNPEVYEAFAALYPGWQFALCCWAGEIDAEPLVWRYESLRPDYLFLPGLDGHNGRAPSLARHAERDHHLVWGSAFRTDTSGYSSLTERVRAALPSYVGALVPPSVRGAPRVGVERNGDWWVLLDALSSGPGLESPPGA